VSGQPRATSRSHSAAQDALRALDGLPVESASALEDWLDALGELPLDRWIALGRACARDTTGHQRRATATALLEAIVADQQLELTAWFIGDMVQTTAYAVTTAASRERRSRRRAVAEARMAAEWAALAIAMQTCLPCVDREALCAPFESAIGSGALQLV
jgi:hypothetical protein